MPDDLRIGNPDYGPPRPDEILPVRPYPGSRQRSPRYLWVGPYLFGVAVLLVLLVTTFAVWRLALRA